MRRLKFTLSRTTLQTIYMTFIRPVLEYGDVIWDNCTQNDKYELDKIQHEAARIVTGATKLVSINELYQDIGWESLETRRRKHKLCLFYKMVNGLTPDYLSSLVPPNVGSTNRYSLRNDNNIHPPYARTMLYSNSFLPSVIREWNQLSLPIREAPTIATFKSRINENIVIIPKHYYYGIRKAQVLHTRLRTNCSSLNHDLYQKNIVDSPMCRCGSVENRQHFFLNCPFYHNIRQDLFQTITQIPDVNIQLLLNGSLDLLLFGSSSLSYEINTDIFQAVHIYILRSKRFV